MRCRPALGRPTCGRALRCVGAPNLRTCLTLRLGADLADVPYVAFGCPSCERAFCCVAAPNLGEAVLKIYLQAKICSYPSSSSSFCLVLPCVDVFVADEFFVWAPILRTRLALCLGEQLAVVPCVALGLPTYGRADVPCVCVADVRWGAQLADVPCVALGRPTCGRALRCVGAPNLGEAVLKILPASENLFLSILQLIF